MKKNWFMAVLAGCLVAVAGTAFANLPDGETTEIETTPALTIIASGEGGGGGSYSAGTTFFLEETPSMTFTASTDGICLVNLDGAVLSNGNNGAKVRYGIAAHDGTGNHFYGNNGITTTVGEFSSPNDAASLGRSALVPIKKGETYVFGWGLETSEEKSTFGTAYPNVDYVCFGG